MGLVVFTGAAADKVEDARYSGMLPAVVANATVLLAFNAVDENTAAAIPEGRMPEQAR